LSWRLFFGGGGFVFGWGGVGRVYCDAALSDLLFERDYVGEIED
jgi:hypothetical protein